MDACSHEVAHGAGALLQKAREMHDTSELHPKCHICRGRVPKEGRKEESDRVHAKERKIRDN